MGNRSDLQADTEAQLIALHRQVAQLRADVAKLAAGLRALAAVVAQRDERATTATARLLVTEGRG